MNQINLVDISFDKDEILTDDSGDLSMELIEENDEEGNKLDVKEIEVEDKTATIELSKDKERSALIYEREILELSGAERLESHEYIIIAKNITKVFVSRFLG